MGKNQNEGEILEENHSATHDNLHFQCQVEDLANIAYFSQLTKTNITMISKADFQR